MRKRPFVTHRLKPNLSMALAKTRDFVYLIPSLGAESGGKGERFVRCRLSRRLLTSDEKSTRKVSQPSLQNSKFEPKQHYA